MARGRRGRVATQDVSPLRSTTLDRVDIATITAAFTNAYTGYFFPMVFTDAATEVYLHAHDIALDASPIWFEGDIPIAVGALGIRERRAWVGAFGIAPDFRGKGLAQPMFGEIVRLAKRKKAAQIQLEVLDRNTRAIEVYARAGFTERRKLFSLESPSITPSSNAQPMELSAALTAPITGEAEPCWQREVRTMERRVHQLAACSNGESFAVFRTGNGDASLLRAQLGKTGSDDTLAAIVRNAGAQSIGITNEPEDSALLRQLYERAWVPTFMQHEMILQF